jgi:hypothetical protein
LERILKGRFSRGRTLAMNQIQVNKNLYPHCILWSPLPPITWILPFIGHTGIADSKGVIYDFAGPYTIGMGGMAFGNPTRYIQLNPEQCSNLSWDEGVEEVSRSFFCLCISPANKHTYLCLNRDVKSIPRECTISAVTIATLMWHNA